MSIRPADRLGQLSEYYFSKKLKTIAKYREQGRDIINLGIGSPDLAPDSKVLDQLVNSVNQSDSHGYQPYQGLPALQEAIVRFHNQHFEKLPANLEVLPLLGSKEGITHISMAYLNPGDEVLIPALAYPTYTSVTNMMGAKSVYFPLDEANQWEPDWDYLEGLDCSRVKLMWINYPHMPTGSRGSKRILEKFVAFAKARNILLCHDNPYSFVLNDQPISVFDVHGAQETCLELSSLSKTFNMAGWRVGWVLGSKELIAPVLTVKSNIDSGMFKPVQMAAIEALQLGKEWFAQMNEVYQSRQALGKELLKSIGCSLLPDQSGMFLWARTSDGNGEEMVERLLESHDVFLAPGMIFGDSGKPYVRLSLCASKELLEKAYQRIS
ncbi:MAG: aminotransferase class I/II-fold pyridoxal phosphate-dependent enzyme [Cyclobacteriaceae bacterium]